MAEQRGLDFLLYTSNGTTWDLVGGQRGITFNMNTDVIDATHKGTATGGPDVAFFKLTLPSFKSWGVDFDAVVTDDGASGFDPGLNNLVNAYINNTRIKVYMLLPTAISDRFWTGFSVLGDFAIGAPNEDVATASGGLVGDGGFTRNSSEQAAT